MHTIGLRALYHCIAWWLNPQTGYKYHQCQEMVSEKGGPLVCCTRVKGHYGPHRANNGKEWED